MRYRTRAASDQRGQLGLGVGGGDYSSSEKMYVETLTCHGLRDASNGLLWSRYLFLVTLPTATDALKSVDRRSYDRREALKECERQCRYFRVAAFRNLVNRYRVQR